MRSTGPAHLKLRGGHYAAWAGCQSIAPKKEGGVPLEGRRLSGARLTSRGFGIEQKVRTPFPPNPGPASYSHNGVVAPVQPHHPCYDEGHFIRDKAIERLIGIWLSDHRSY